MDTEKIVEVEQICYWKICVNLLFSVMATVVVIAVGIKAIFFFMPFVIGWVISMIASPLVKILEKRLKIVRKLGSALIIILVLGLIVALVYLVLIGLWEAGIGFVQLIPSYYESLDEGLDQIVLNFDVIIRSLPSGVTDALHAIADGFDTYMGEVISIISEPTVSAAGNIAMKIPGFLISIIITIVAAYFFITDRDMVIIWAKKVTPQAIQKRMELVTYNFKYAIGGYFKAQFKIMGVVYVILAICLLLLGVEYALLVSLLIALLDFLPFFGTGVILCPWGVYQFLIGEYKMAIFLIGIYILTQAVRQLIQPKLVADSINMNPLVTLILLYVGFKFGGVLGMIAAIPVGLISINLVKAGAFDYIIKDVKILVDGILSLRK